jgi:general secretion pathway protein J
MHAAHNTFRRYKSGFTLLEILVVLVLVSLISTLIMAGFSFTINLQSRLQHQLVDNQLKNLQESWFRQTTHAYFNPTQSTKGSSFSGNTHKISGTSLVSLTGKTGIPVMTTWLIETNSFGQQLSYTSDDIEKTIIASWPIKDLEFQFLDKDGEFSSRWPTSELNSHPPKGILLSSKSLAGITWYVSLSNSAPPLLNLELLEF